MTNFRIPTMFCLFLCAAFCMMAACGEIKAAENDGGDKEVLEQMYAEMYRAMIAKDTVSLGNMMTDSFVLVHMTGGRQSKAEYLTSIAGGSLNYYSCEDTQLDIAVDGNTALMTGCSQVEAKVGSGGKRIWPLKLDIDLEKKDGRWIMTEIRAGMF